MTQSKVRREIARRAARLMYLRDEKEYYTAKRKAARQCGVGNRLRASDLPSNAEIREEIQLLAQFHEGRQRFERLTEMRLEALRRMRQLARFQPYLIGSVWTGHVRQGSDIDLHVFTDSIGLLLDALDAHGMRYRVERKRVLKHNEERVFTHVHVDGRIPMELTVYPADKVNYPFRSSITGGTIERASIAALERRLREEDPHLDLDGAMERLENHVDVFDIFRSLLQPLEDVKQDPRWHPEGDALFHSLQVFELARGERPYDEEFLLAALLHDVGKAIDPHDHVGASLLALEGAISERTAFLIEHHMQAHAYRESALGHRAAMRLRGHEDFEDLILLSELDHRGRVPGAAVGTLEEALAYIREIAAED